MMLQEQLENNLNAMDISEGKRPPGGLWFDIDIENLIVEGEAHLFTFIHNGTLNEKELVVRIQTPDFSPTETHYSLHLPPGSVEKMTFVQPEDVETQVFEWGKLNWLSEPLVTMAERFSCGLVTLEPGKGHARHNHPYSEEILYVIEGKGMQTVELTSGILEKEID